VTRNNKLIIQTAIRALQYSAIDYNTSATNYNAESDYDEGRKSTEIALHITPI